MFCGYCGTELPDNAEFCSSCGKAVQKQNANSAPPAPDIHGNGAPASAAPAGSGYHPVAPADKKSWKANSGRSRIRILTCAAMAVVLVVTVVRARNAADRRAELELVLQQLQARTSLQTYDQPQQNMQTSPQEDDAMYSVQETPAVDDTASPAADYTAVRTFLRNYSGDWSVDRYFDKDERKWKIYELGKRLFIAGYNFFNDGSYTTGGYDVIVGYEEEEIPPSGGGGTCPKCHEGKLSRVSGIDGLLSGSSSYTYQCDLCGYSETLHGETKKTPIYERVGEEVHEYHGEDIEYNPPGITLTEDSVDMTGMGGTVYDYTAFRIENINDRLYLINDAAEFAFLYDGTYLEYCELDYSGQYQGFYAFQ